MLSGIDNAGARINGQGNGHFSALCGLTSGCIYTGRGAGGPSIDQLLAARIGTKSRFRSLEIGVAQESHGENVHRNMSWAGYDRALEIEPKMAEAFLGRALVLKKLARLEDALASVNKAIELKGDVAKMHEARASLLRSLGREDDAHAADARAAELEAKKREVSETQPSQS